MAGDHRSAENRARDQYRHPQQTLEFFGIRPEMTVIEIWPEGGWYTEILAPYLHDKGRYIAAHFDPESKQEFVRSNLKAFQEKLAARPDLYGKVEMAVLQPPDKTEMAPAESVDMVVTFRNIHNWMGDGQADAVFAAMYRVLKPGGVLGVVEHRASSDKPQDPKAKSGYVRRGLRDPARREGRLRAGGDVRDQRQPEGHQGLRGRRLDAAADAATGREGQGEVSRDRRERPLHAALPQAGLGRGCRRGRGAGDG